jgi:hypothetical protein
MLRTIINALLVHQIACYFKQRIVDSAPECPAFNRLQPNVAV